MNRLSTRLQRPDFLQVSALFLAVLVVLLNLNWPAAGVRVNQAWPVIASLRNSALALLGLAFGAQHTAFHGLGARGRSPDVDAEGRAGAAQEGRRQARDTWLALVVLTLVTWPFELVSQAATYPGTPAYWPAVVALLTVTAFFGLGLALGRLVRGNLAGFLLLLCVPGALALSVWLDAVVGTVVLNPWAAPLSIAPVYLAAVLLLTLLTSAWLFRGGPRPRGGRA